MTKIVEAQGKISCASTFKKWKWKREHMKWHCVWLSYYLSSYLKCTFEVKFLIIIFFCIWNLGKLLLLFAGPASSRTEREFHMGRFTCAHTHTYTEDSGSPAKYTDKPVCSCCLDFPTHAHIEKGVALQKM